jgi:DNA primase
MADDFVTDDLDVESYLSWIGVDYKTSSGSSGVQLHVKECPNPECGNDNWKVYLNAETGLGNCFACSKTYNKWSFAKAFMNMEGRELFAHFAEVKKALGYKVEVRKKPLITAEVAGELEMPTSIALPTRDGANAIYLENRGITAEYAAYFHLRYCAQGWHNYIKVDGSKGGQNCADRIIIPVYDLDGTLKTFQARDVTGEAEIRYIFPATLPGTGRYLYNGQNAYLWGCSEVIMNEGPFDVAAVKRVIDRHDDMKGIVPVGSFGKHLSVSLDGKEDQLGKFVTLKRRGLKRVTIMWDGEREALDAALTAAEHLWKKLGLEVYIALLPAGKDPDECDQIEVYQAWKNAFKVTAMTLVKYRMKNPYPKLDKNPLDLTSIGQ